MYERTTSSTTYKIPQCCCNCLGPPDKLLWIIYAREWIHEGIKYQQSYQYDVPICSSCKSGVYKRRFLGVGLFVATVVLAWFVWQQEWDEWEIWTCIGIVIAGFITVTCFWFGRLPADTNDSGVPIFRNAQYQKLFNEANEVRPYRPENYDPLEEDVGRAESKASIDPASKPQAAQFVPLFEFGSETSILGFPVGAESKYANHVKLIEHLAAAGAFPKVRICGLKAGTNASCSRLILITGSDGAVEALPSAYLGDVADEFVKSKFGGDWTEVNAESTLSNVAEPVFGIGDRGRFNELCQEIERGAYYLDRRVV